MAGSRKRVKRVKRGRSRSNRAVPMALPSFGVMSLRLLRNFTLYPKQLSGTTPSSSWLDSLVSIGCFALKMFLVAVGYTELGATSYPTGAIQCVAYGAEDLLWSSAIRETKTISRVVDASGKTFSYEIPFVDFRQARLRRLTIRVTPSAETAKRGGRFAIAVVPVSLTEATNLGELSYKIEPVTFEFLMQMPGAIVVPASRAVTRTWTPRSTDYGFGFKTIGQMTEPSISDTGALVPIKGGDPVCFVYFGYQDMASSSASDDNLYTPEVSTFNVDISGDVALREYGRSFVRLTPQVLMNSATIGLSTPVGRKVYDVPVNAVSRGQFGYLVENSVLPDELVASMNMHQVDSSTPSTPFSSLTLD